MSRLHKSLLFKRDGEFIGIDRLPIGLYSAYQAVIRKIFNIYPPIPWIPFAAIKYLDKLIQKDWRILEFGSGMSTPWMAKRAGHITSYEADENWHKKLSETIAKNRITNVTLIYEWQGHIMSSYTGITDKSLDLLYIDGGPRGDCLINGYDKVRDGGYIYLDNWDSGDFWSNHLGDSRAFLSSKSASHSLIFFEDYVPSMPTIQQSLLVKKNVSVP